MDPEMLSLLCTPDTREPLVEASEEVLAKVNAEIEKGSVKNAYLKMVVGMYSIV